MHMLGILRNLSRHTDANFTAVLTPFETDVSPFNFPLQHLVSDVASDGN